MQPPETKNGNCERAMKIRRGRTDCPTLVWSSEGEKRVGETEAMIKGVRAENFPELIDIRSSMNPKQYTSFLTYA